MRGSHRSSATDDALGRACEYPRRRAGPGRPRHAVSPLPFHEPSEVEEADRAHQAMNDNCGDYTTVTG